MENKELLDKTVIDESLYEYCFIKDGIVYPPLMENNTVIKTGEERYNEKFNAPKKDNVLQKFLRKVVR